MPLEFTGIYKLTNISKNYLDAPQIAMAPRVARVVGSEDELLQEELQYLSPNNVILGHSIAGTVVYDENGVVDVRDDLRRGDDGKEVVWRFEPLTFENWTEMGEAGHISGWDEVKELVSDDKSLLQFYYSQWLLPRLDWWKETPEV